MDTARQEKHTQNDTAPVIPPVDPPVYDKDGGAPFQQPPPPTGPSAWRRLRVRASGALPHLALPAAVVVGGGIFAGTTYALVRHVQELLRTASVNPDPAYWAQVARTKAYDGCYLGCAGCDDPNYAWDACARTAQGNVSGIVCDGTRMWNWPDGDRYPALCLDAVGQLYKADELAGLKNHYRAQYAVVLVTILAGVLGGGLTYCLWRAWARRRGQRAAAAAAARQRADPWRNNNVPDAPGQSSARPNRMKRLMHKNRGTGAGQGRFARLLTLGGLLSRGASAFPCTGYDSVASQYFVSSGANHTVAGRIHGWMSSCYHYSCNCWTSCTSCSCTSSGCSTCCSTYCQTCTASDRAPRAFVNDVLPRVRACGFDMVDGPPATALATRVAHPGIERTWWVKIEVSGLNVTEPGATDESVVCLHGIGDLKK